MPVGNLRTAANDERDDDPRALRPIPIATKDAVSFVEKNTPPGQNAEVVRYFLCFSPTSRFDHHRRFRMMSMMTRACARLLRFRATKVSSLKTRRLWVLALFVVSLSFSLGKRRAFSSRDLIFLIFLSRERWSRCVVLWMRVTQRDDHERQRDDEDYERRAFDREKRLTRFIYSPHLLYSFYPTTTTTESV